MQCPVCHIEIQDMVDKCPSCRTDLSPLLLLEEMRTQFAEDQVNLSRQQAKMLVLENEIQKSRTTVNRLSLILIPLFLYGLYSFFKKPKLKEIVIESTELQAQKIKALETTIRTQNGQIQQLKARLAVRTDTFHIIRKNDTLEELAVMFYGASSFTDTLIIDNGVKNTRRLAIGNALIIRKNLIKDSFYQKK